MSILKVRDKNGNVTDIPAIRGKSAYEYAKDGGYTGTETEFAEDIASVGDIGTMIPTKVSQLANDTGYLTTNEGDQRYAKTTDIPTEAADVGADPAGAAQTVAENIAEELVNYCKKSNTYSKNDVDNLISVIPKFEILVVDSLPTSGVSSTTVYLVKEKTSTGDLYTEYIYVRGAWEELGRQTVNLAGYVTSSKLTEILGDYAVKANVPTKTSQLTNDSNFATTAKAETWTFTLEDGSTVTKKVVLA